MMNEKDEPPSYFNNPQSEAPFTSNLPFTNNSFSFSIEKDFIKSVDGILRLLIVVSFISNLQPNYLDRELYVYINFFRFFNFVDLFL